MLKLAPNTEVRTNWKIYLDEFAQAAAILGYKTSTVEEFVPKNAISRFEKKYMESGARLYRLIVKRLPPKHRAI